MTIVWVVIVFCCAAAVCGSIAYVMFRRVPKLWAEQKTVSIQGALKVGIISDSQLYPFARKSNKGKFEENLTYALRGLKAQGVQLILFGGDICNLGTARAYNAMRRCWNEVFADHAPVLQAVLGNHDYWGFPTTRAAKAKLFQKKVGHAPWTHYVVGGVHFIGVSPDCGSTRDAYKNVLNWLDQQLQLAVADTPDSPIFVLTHHAPEATVAGSYGFGDRRLHSILKNYPNVVNFSGHTHHSLLDEKSILQRGYTMCGTQSVSYVELEKGKENGTVPPNAYAASMGLVMHVNHTQVEILRYQFRPDGAVEQKPNHRWKLHFPMQMEGAQYKDERQPFGSAPKMTAETAEAIYDKKRVKLKFSAAVSDDFVRGYLVRYSDGTQQYYFSDFYRGLDKMTNMPRFTLINKKPGVYDIRVYAIDSWGRVSDNYAKCENVRIKRRHRYVKVHSTFLRKLPMLNTVKRIAGFIEY